MTQNPRAFISFDFDHNDGNKMYFVGQSRNSRTPFTIQDWSSKEALSQSKWEEIIETKVGRCHIMIVLVGRHMATATGVKKEIAMAKRKNVPIFGVYVDSANSLSALPEGLPRSRVIAWEWGKIAQMIAQTSKEGKNQ